MSYQKTTFVDRISEYPTRRKLTTIDTQQVYGTWDVSRDEGTVSQEGTALNAATFNQMQDNIAAAFAEVDANIAPTYDSTATYSEGDLVIYEGVLYKANVDISTAEEWDATHWDAVKITEIMGTGSAVIDDSVVSTETAWSSSRIAGFLPTDTASGAIATFTDGADGIPVKSLVASIVATQSGSGTPSPTNIRPISGWSSVNVTRTGKNLFSPEKAVADSDNADTYISGDWLYFRTGGSPMSYYINSDKQLTISGTFKNETSTNNILRVRASYTDGTVSDMIYATMTDTNEHQLSGSSISGKVIHRVYVAYTNSAVCMCKNVQLETGSTATAYEPYTGTTANIPLGSTYYGGSLEVETGVLTVDSAIVDLGSLFYAYYEYGSISGGYSNTLENVIKKPTSSSALSDSISDKLVQYSDTQFESSPDNTYAINTYGRIKIHKSGVTNATELKNALSGYMLVYPLATPTTVQLTPTEVKTILGNNNIFADSGEVEVVYRADIGLYIAKKTA